MTAIASLGFCHRKKKADARTTEDAPTPKQSESATRCTASRARARAAQRRVTRIARRYF